MTELELYHYGVKGMKWGVHRNSSRAYTKASRKFDKLNRRIDKRERVMKKKIRKAEKNLTRPWLLSGGNKKQSRLYNDARIAAAEYRKALRKGKTWFDAMDNTFKKSEISLSSEQLARGQKYATLLLSDMMAHY
jgi:predicted secreted hydrolase